jgi:hypothetical protein
MQTIKAFNKDEKGYFCQPFIDKFYYEEGKTYKMDKEQVKLCYSGFHASANFDISDTLILYNLPLARYGIVEVSIVEKDDREVVGDEITIVKFLPDDFNVLIQYDKSGLWTYSAGVNLIKFDYKLGFEKLLEVDKTGESIYYAGKYWNKFNYELGFKRLSEIDKTNEWTILAEHHWKKH